PEAHQSNSFALSFRVGVKLERDELSQQAGHTVKFAKEILLRARNKLEHRKTNEVSPYAEYYFGWESGEIENHWTDLLKSVKTLEQAIGNPFLIKITDEILTTNEISEDGTADGRVRPFQKPSKQGAQFPRNEIIPYVPMDYRFKNRGFISRKYSDPAYMGNVHMKASLFADTQSATLVLIHEFCHKYLGFHDGPENRWYFGADGETLPKDAVGPARAETADAMAWFIVKIAGKMDNMDMIAVNPTFTTPPSWPGCCILS
ncbi:MAG: hypothetical protein ACRD06_08095, partial [Terriglobia bacterium]